jgi:small subunit ribosomal protein S20
LSRSLSSRKRIRQNVKRAARNKARITLIKSKVRKMSDAVGAKDVAAADKAFREAAQTLDRSALRHSLHRNTAARRKSRLAKRLNALKVAGRK